MIGPVVVVKHIDTEQIQCYVKMVRIFEVGYVGDS